MKNLYYYEAKKLYKGYIFVRDYNLNECNNSGKDLVIKYKNEEMIIKNSDLKLKALKLDKTLYKSQFAGSKDYKVYHFKWEPIKVVNKQMSLLN